MLSKNQIKRISKLTHKKYREQERCFIVEGKKSILEFLKADFKLVELYCTERFTEGISTDCQWVSENELRKISQLKNPDEGLAIFEIPTIGSTPEGLIVALDAVRDPGNLGTIIRLCDWFGVTQLVCSKDTVDCYNPKVVQSTMGSLARVSVHYLDLKAYLLESEKPILGAVMDGENVYQTELPSEGILIMGNEANGISKDIQKCLHKRLTIPKFGSQQTESLNVATATAILLSEFRRSEN